MTSKIFTNFEKLLERVNRNKYPVEYYERFDDEEHLIVGFRCKQTKNAWSIKSKDFLKSVDNKIWSYYKSKAGKEIFLKKLNKGKKIKNECGIKTEIDTKS